MKAYCQECNKTIEKPQWEHLINYIYRKGGHAGENKCPRCKQEGLRFDWGEGLAH